MYVETRRCTYVPTVCTCILIKVFLFNPQGYVPNPYFNTSLVIVHYQLYMYIPSAFDFQSRPQSSWEEKYQVKGKSLSLAQIRNYGRQVLEVDAISCTMVICCMTGNRHSK